MRHLFSTAALCTLAAVMSPHAMAANWHELNTPNFTLWAESNDGATRTLAWQLEQIRNVAKTLWPWMKVDLPKPVVVVAVKDEGSMRALAPQYWEVRNGVRPVSVWVSAPDHHYIAIRTNVPMRDDVMVNPHIAAYFSYANLVFTSSLASRPPLWLSRGLSGLLSNTLIRQDDVIVGAAIPWHLESLRARRLPLKQMLSVSQNDPQIRNQENLRYFDAQSWAFVHYLMFSDDGARASRLNGFVGQLERGDSPEAAFASAIGNVDDYERDFATYVNRNLYSAARIRANMNLDRTKLPARQMSAAETLASRASIHVALSRPTEARALLDEAMKTDPASPFPVALDAIMLDRGGNAPAARAAYEKAAALGSRSAYVHFRLATLNRSTEPAALEAVEASLARAIELNPLFAAAHANLAQVRAQLNRPQISIVPHMHKAVALEPSSAWHRIVAARILGRLGATDEARKAAESALKLADDDASARAEAEQILSRLKG